MLLIMSGQWSKLGLQGKQGHLVTLYLALIVCDRVSVVPSRWAKPVRFQGLAVCAMLAVVVRKAAVPKGYDLCKRNPFLLPGR